MKVIDSGLRASDRGYFYVDLEVFLMRPEIYNFLMDGENEERK